MAAPASLITLAATGGSGAAYTLRLLECLLQAGCQVDFLVSNAGRQVIQLEENLNLPEETDVIHRLLMQRLASNEQNANIQPEQLNIYGNMDWMAPVASGTARHRQMVICPASGGCTSAIAHGASDNLIERAADVAIKEKYPLIIVPRETPLSAIHLENMLKLAHLGVTVMPACPGFYYQPKSVSDLVDFMVGRILHHLGIDQDLLPGWGEN